MVTKIYTVKFIDGDAIPVTIETSLSAGIGIHLVGLADAEIKECLLRTITALQSANLNVPGKKIVINIAPSDLKKRNCGYDLPIALGIVSASGQKHLPLLDKYLVIGELGLNGSVRPVPNTSLIADLAARNNFKGCILPKESAMSVSGMDGTEVYAVSHLSEAIDILSGESECSNLLAKNIITFNSYIDLSDVNSSMELDSGQEVARLEKGKYVVTLEVRGDVKVQYRDCTYRCASNMPEELIQMFHEWKPEYEKVVNCVMNNWFELFLWEKGEDGMLHWSGISDVCDAENEDKESIRKSLEEYLEDNIKQII